MDLLNDGFSSASSSPEANSIMKVAIESDRDTDRPCQHAVRYSHSARPVALYDVAKLKRLARRATRQEIAEKLGRSVSATSVKAHKLKYR
jgi:hypothetical protein